MASADFSQFVVTTADETACETSPVKVRILSLHAPAAFTRTSGNFWTLVYFATLSVFPSLICGSCPSGQRFAYSFFQIPSRGGHPCCSAMCFVVAYAHSGLSPVRKRPCWANKNIPIPCSSSILSNCNSQRYANITYRFLYKSLFEISYMVIITIFHTRSTFLYI